MKHLLLLLVFSSSLFSETLLVAPERSGSHWLMFSLGFLTNRAYTTDSIDSQELKKLQNSPFFNPFKLDLDTDNPIVLHTHRLEYAKKNMGQNKIIITLRHPIESKIAVSRFYKHFPQRYIPLHEWSSYCDIIKLYEGWDHEKRLLIYFEDIINDPEETLRTVLNFLEEKEDRLGVYLSQIDTLRGLSKQAYNKRFPNKPAISTKTTDAHRKTAHLFTSRMMKESQEFFQTLEDGKYYKYVQRYYE